MEGKEAELMLMPWNRFTKENGSSLVPMSREFDRLFNAMERAFGDVALPAMGWSFDALVPAADVIETAEAVTVRMDLPGHDPKAIHVNVENDILTVRSERKSEIEERQAHMHRSERSYGMYARSFVLPATVDAARAEAKYERGVLTVTLPKRADAKSKRIDIKVRS